MAYYTANILRNPGRPGRDARGKVLIRQDDVASSFPWTKVRIDVYNYNIDGNVLKDEHKKWLDSQLIPFLKLHKYHIELHGRTSSSGNADYNRKLSLQRVLLLKEYLIEDGGLSESQVPGERMRADGETGANQAVAEDEFDRAVTILLRRGRKTRPSVRVRIGKTTLGRPPWLETPPEKKTGLPPTKTSRTEPPEKEFQIRYAGGVQAGAEVIGFGQHYFEVIDDQYQQFGFLLQGPIGQLKTPFAGAVTDAGDRWITMKCRIDKIEDLAGKRGILWGAGGGRLNPFWLSIPDCRVYGREIPTGRTIGIGVDKLSGTFIRDTTYQPPPIQ